MADNIQMAQQLLAINQQILDVMERQKVIMGGQVGITKDIVSAASTAPVGGLKDAFSNMSDSLGHIREEVLGTNGQIKEGNKHLEATNTWLGGMGRSIRNYAEQVAKGTGHAVFLKNAMKSVWETSVNLYESFKQILSSVWNIGQALWSIPNNVLKGMIALSNDWAEAMKPIWMAYENFRKDFGAFYNIAGKALKEGIASAKQMSAMGGASYFSIFESTAEAIQFFQEQFKGLGPLMDSFGTEIGAMGGKFVHFAKGMGLSGEQTKSFALVAKATGKTLETYLGEVSSMGMQMADAFGIADKSMHQDFAEMTADASHFGNMSVKSMAATIVRTRSLGLEVKTLGKIVDKFLNFDEAAQNASKLSQAFGVNLDTLGLMKGAAAGGGDALDQIRNAMFAAGKDASKMSTAELRLLSSTSGLSEEEAKLAFSMSNRGKSMEEIRKQASKSQKKELTQTEMMGRLADSIERVVRVLKHETFFDTFFVGLQRGIKQSKPFTKMMSNLHFSLDQIQYAGVEVGAAFVEMFPGVKKVMSTFSDIFDPKYFATVRKRIVGAFKNLFMGMSLLTSKNPKAKKMGSQLVEYFWHSFKDTLLEVRDRINTIFPVVFNAVWKGMLALKDVFLLAMPEIKAGLIKGLRAVTWYLKDSLTKAMSGQQSDLMKMFISPISYAISEAWHDPEFQSALGEFGAILSRILKEGLKSAWAWLSTETSKQVDYYWAAFKRDASETGKMYMQQAWDEFPVFMTSMATKAFDYFKTDIIPLAGKTMGFIGKSIVDILMAPITNSDEILKTIKKAFALVFDGIALYFKVDAGLNKIGSDMAAGLASGFLGGLESIPQKMMGIFGGEKNSIVDKSAKSSVDMLTNVNAKVAEISKNMAAIPEINVPIKIEEIGKVLGIKNNTLKVQMNPVNITLNLSVTLEADTLAKALLETKLLMPGNAKV